MKRHAVPAIVGPLTVVCGLLLGGCHGSGRGGGDLTVRSLGDDPVQLDSSFDRAFYAHDRLAESSFLLSDVSPDDLSSGDVEFAQVLHVGLLWQPEPGKTPMDQSATNVSLRYVVVARGEVGIYGGGGFALFSGTLGKDAISMTIRDSSLRLIDSTDGFHDALGAARITGSFHAVLDPDRARQVRFGISQLVTDALGRSRMVRSTTAVAGG